MNNEVEFYEYVFIEETQSYRVLLLPGVLPRDSVQGRAIPTQIPAPAKYIDGIPVRDYSCLFSGLRGVEHLDLSLFDTSLVIDMSGLCRFDTNLQTIKFGNCDLTSVKNWDHAFLDCERLIEGEALSKEVCDTLNEAIGRGGIFHTPIEEEPGVSICHTTTWKEFETKPVYKKPYLVYACRPPLGTTVHNIIDNTDYVTGRMNPIVMSGTVGEMWACTQELLVENYTLQYGAPISLDGHGFDWLLVRAKPGHIAWAQFFPMTAGQTKVHTRCWGVQEVNRRDVSHGDGDFIMMSDNNGAPNLEDQWVVDGRVFHNIYGVECVPQRPEETF